MILCGSGGVTTLIEFNLISSVVMDITEKFEVQPRTPLLVVDPSTKIHALEFRLFREDSPSKKESLH